MSPIFRFIILYTSSADEKGKINSQVDQFSTIGFFSRDARLFLSLLLPFALYITLMRIALRLMVLLIFPVITLSQVLPDETPQAQSMFAQAQRLMRQKDYLGAIDVFNALARDFKNSRYHDVYNYGLARGYYHLGDFEKTINALTDFPRLFPDSYLLAYAYHLQANAYYRLDRVENAFRGYLQALIITNDERLRQLSERSLLAAIENGYIPSDSLIGRVPDNLICRVKNEVLQLVISSWSQDRIDRFMGDCPRTATMKEKTPTATEGAISIGLLLPLSGPYDKYGQAVLDGAMLAVKTLREKQLPVELITYDTRADNVTAARQALTLSEAKVDVIVGPLLSSVAATVAAVLSHSDIPLLVPAATQAGFTELSPTCYQMSPNILTIARGLAQYAVRYRAMTTLAVLSPTGPDELIMAEAFENEVRRLGARLVAIERFRSGETDFGSYIRDLKNALAGPDPDSIFYVTLGGDTLRPGEMPVSIDGLFIPAAENDLFQLLPQLDFYRVSGVFLGTDEWDREKIIKLGESVLDDNVIYSTHKAMAQSPGFDLFASLWDAQYGSEPDRLGALGFDAVTIAGEACRQSPEDPNEYIRGLKKYKGAAGIITFGRSRTNLELPLFSIRKGQVQSLAEQEMVVEPIDEEAPADSVAPSSIRD